MACERVSSLFRPFYGEKISFVKAVPLLIMFLPILAL